MLGTQAFAKVASPGSQGPGFGLLSLEKILPPLVGGDPTERLRVSWDTKDLPTQTSVAFLPGLDLLWTLSI